MSVITSNSRGVDKYSSIASEIRRWIATGQFSPGSQLPQRAELEDSFQVSKVTLQRAMNILIEDGFIDVTRSKGSFVAARPPHLSRYALAFEGDPGGSGRWLRSWTALVNEASRYERQEDCTIPVYYGIDGHTDTADYQKLLSEVEEHRLAGVIFVADFPSVPDLSLLEKTGVPGVTVQSAAHHGLPCVTIDEESFIHKALDEVRELKCQRVAFLCPPEYAERRGAFLLREVAVRGMEMKPYWIQSVSLNTTTSARNCMQLLMSLPSEERPDALIITDDNLVEPASVGLMASGKNHTLKVIAHANFPWVTTCIVEARRLGYDVRSLLGACLQVIDAQRKGEAIQTLIKVPAQFEEELAG